MRKAKRNHDSNEKKATRGVSHQIFPRYLHSFAFTFKHWVKFFPFTPKEIGFFFAIIFMARAGEKTARKSFWFASSSPFARNKEFRGKRNEFDEKWLEIRFYDVKSLSVLAGSVSRLFRQIQFRRKHRFEAGDDHRITFEAWKPKLSKYLKSRAQEPARGPSRRSKARTRKEFTRFVTLAFPFPHSFLLVTAQVCNESVSNVKDRGPNKPDLLIVFHLYLLPTPRQTKQKLRA